MRRRRSTPKPTVKFWPDGRQVCDCNKLGCGDSIPGRARLAAAQNPPPAQPRRG